MKPKNTFAKLRSELKQVIVKANIANRKLKLKEEENKRLQKALESEQKANKFLNNRILVELKEKQILSNKLFETSNLKDKYYKWYIEEIDRKNKATSSRNKAIVVMLITIIGLISYIIKGQ